MRLILALLLAWWQVCPVFAGTIYIDTAANGSASANFSGSTDTTTAKAGTGSGTATITCSAVTYTGALPGCSFSGLPDLSTVITTPGATQDSVYVSCATNSNQKVFWIVAVDNTANPRVVETETTGLVPTAPTGCTAATATWNIGGRALLTNATLEGALRAGDTAIFNISPASQAATSWTVRNPGDTTSGYATLKGKTGVRPVLTTSGSGNATISNGQLLVWVENLEVKQTHVSTGVGITAAGAGQVYYNVKVSAAPGNGMTATGNNVRVINSEITGAGGDGINENSSGTLSGDYIHDNTGDCFENSNTTPSVVIVNSIFDTCGGRGVFFSGAITTAYANPNIFTNNTVYGNLTSGFETTDADLNIIMINNIFSTNGDAAGEYNVKWAAGSAEMASFHAYNDFYHANCQGSNTGGPACVFGLTLNAQVAASEIQTDPLMASPAAGNFTLNATSPALGAGFPGQLLGATGLGYAELGAEQSQAVAGSGGNGIIGGGM